MIKNIKLEHLLMASVTTYVGYQMIKDTQLVRDQVDVRTRGPELAGLGAVGGFAAGFALHNQAIKGAALGTSARGISKLLSRSHLLKSPKIAFALAGVGAAVGYGAGESAHSHLGPEVIIPAAAKVGVATILISAASYHGINYLAGANKSLVQNLKSTRTKVNLNKLGKVGEALNKVRLSKAGLARILTGLSVVGAAKVVENRSVRKARESQTRHGDYAGMTMSHEEFADHLTAMDTKKQSGDPLVDIKVHRESYYDSNKLSEMFK